MEGVAQVQDREGEQEQEERAVNCREDEWLWMCSPDGGKAQDQAHFGGITEIPHWAVMGELTHGSDKKACAVFEKCVIYHKVSGKVHIPYLEKHCFQQVICSSHR